MFLMKFLFPKLVFGIDDLNGGGGAPDKGQPEPEPSGNDLDPNPDPAPEAPTDFVDFKGVKIPASEFETLAKEKYKDRFEAFDNREKWQAENTRKAQELAQDKRDAEAYRRQMAEPQEPAQSRDPYQKAKTEYIQDMKRDFPDLDDRFLGKQFDWQMKLAGQRAEEFVSPIQNQQAEAYEAKFLSEHPKVQKGTPQYEKIAKLMGAGVDAEEAYDLTFPEDRINKAIKQRDEDAKRKLQQSRTQSTPANKTKAKGDEVFENNWNKFGGN